MGSIKMMILRPSISSVLLSFYVFFFMHCVGILTTGTYGFSNETDRQALLSIKNLVQDPYEALSSWNTSHHFCNWQGVICGHQQQRVTALNISSLKLVGSLSPSIGNLSFLMEINLQENNFHGTIPQEIGRLLRLQYLRLANNSFQGKVPTNLSHCSDLNVVDLTGNNLEGSIPVEWSSLSRLHELSLKKNSLTGNIPRSFGNLSSIRLLSVAKNSLDGSIPVELGKLSNLQFFACSSNNLSGIIPEQLYNISSIQTFSVTNNQLTGPFPPNLGLALPNLLLFQADVNGFYGSIPASLANASGLVKFSVGNNKLTGPIPLNFGILKKLQVFHISHNPFGNDKSNDISFLSSLTNCSNLQVLSLSAIQIGGVLPDSIANFSNTLTLVWLDQNYIAGSIPIGIGSLVGLSYLTIDTNLLTGTIPDSIGRLSQMQELYFFNNNISGNIPSSIGNITGLNILILQDNVLEGSIPASLGNCSNLQGLHLRRNRLSGTIPEEILSLSSLSIGLILDENYLTGSLPSQVGNLKNLALLDISNNQLFGEIPDTIGNCIMLDSLYMAGNFFKGTIPSSLGQLKGIKEMDLSRNNLSGPIPKSLGALRVLTSLNLSFNMLEGEVPNEGVFTNISQFSILGNRKLCGGIMASELLPCPIKVPEKNGGQFPHKIIALIVILPIVMFLTCLAVILCRVRRSKQRSSSASLLQDHYPKLSYDELRLATDGFSSNSLIGEGRYGSVYKGILNSGELIVAIKVLKLEEHGAAKSFLAECEALRNVRHKNLVKIITSCSTIDFKQNDFKALVFEFMPNGSLDSWIHPSSPQELEVKNLHLIQRLNIAIDVASALDYLHNHCEAPIIHCDLKPSNVLLDNDLCAHVSDFGLARFLLATNGNLSENNSSSIGIRGTVGYAAPEYGMGGKVSTQGDMYSYGILLLEIFTGKRPTSNMFTGDRNLINYVKMALPDEVMEIVDAQILSEENDESNDMNSKSSSKISESLAGILHVGILCCAEMPNERAHIRDVLKELHRIRSLLTQMGGKEGQKGGKDLESIVIDL